MSAAAVATAPEVPSSTKAAWMATTKVSSSCRALPERLVMPAVHVMVLPVMVVPEVRIVASTPPSISVRVWSVSITWIAIVVITGFTASAYSKA
jgi:hypothetical protein